MPVLNNFDDLNHFRQWWLANRVINTPPDGVIFQKDTYGLVLYREGPYQVELFIMKPSVDVMDHIHPNVDTYEVHLTGDVIFSVVDTFSQDAKRKIGDYIRVPENVAHSAQIHAGGGAFLSIQKWLNNVPPTSVTLDWEGKDGSTTYDNSDAKNKIIGYKKKPVAKVTTPVKGARRGK